MHPESSLAYSKKDLASGLIFAAFGAAYGTMAYLNLPMGRALNMGPGYFPIVLSSLLILLGLFVAVSAFGREDGTPIGKAAWRGVTMIMLALAVFVLTLQPLGLLPASVLTSFVACLSMPSVSLVQRALVSLCIGAFCVVVFTGIVKLPIPIIGTVLR